MVQITIELGFRDGLGNTVLRDGFQLQIHIDSSESDLNLDIRTIHTHLVSGYIAGRRRAQYLATGDIKDGPMPGAGNFAAVNFTFAQWAADMRAGVVDRVKRSVDIEERDLVAIYLD